MNTALLSIRNPAFQMITVAKETGLGLKILGGINRNEGPLVYVQDVIPGGDCDKVKTKWKCTLPAVKNKKSTSSEFVFLLYQ